MRLALVWAAKQGNRTSRKVAWLGAKPRLRHCMNDRGYATLSIDVQDDVRPNAVNTVIVRVQGTLDRT